MRGRRSALDAQYVFPGHRGGPVSRQTIALAAAVLAIVLGGNLIQDFGAGHDDLAWIVRVSVVAVGAVAGAFYHPIRRFWWRGAVCGIVISAGAFAAERVYAFVRPQPLSIEFAVVVALGGCPGVFLYRWLMRKQRV